MVEVYVSFCTQPSLESSLTPTLKQYQSCYTKVKDLKKSAYVRDFTQISSPQSVAPVDSHRISIVKTFTKLFQVAKRIDIKVVSQNDNQWAAKTFGLQRADLTYATIAEAGGLLCSLPMLLQHLGLVDDKDQAFNNPTKTDKLLKDAKLYTQETSIDVEGFSNLGFSFVKQYLTIDDDVLLRQQVEDVTQVQIFGYMLAEDSTLRYGFCYDSVISNGKVTVLDPKVDLPYELSLNQIISYITFKVDDLNFPLNLHSLNRFIGRIPIYHVELKLMMSPIKRFMLQEWNPNNNFFQMTGIVLDSDSPEYLKNTQYTLFIQGENVIESAKVYLSNQFTVDINSYITKTTCTGREIQNFIGSGRPYCYENSLGQYSVCHDNPIKSTAAQCQKTQVSEVECSQYFWNRLAQTKLELQTQLGLTFDNEISAQSCSLIKFTYLFGVQTLTQNQEFMAAYNQANFVLASSILFQTYEMCSLRPDQTLEIYYSLSRNKGPRMNFIEGLYINEAPISSSRMKQVHKLRQQISTEVVKLIYSLDKPVTKYGGWCARNVTSAIQRALDLPAERWGDAYKMGPKLEKVGFRPKRGLTYDEAFEKALIGDVIIIDKFISPKTQQEKFHAQIRCSDPKMPNIKWCSDAIQLSSNPYLSHKATFSFTLYRYE